MADLTRRHSRYPAVNRDVPPTARPGASVAPVEAPKEPEAPETPKELTEVPEELVEAPKEAVEAPQEEETAAKEEEAEERPDIAEMSTKEVLAWVGDDEDRRAWAIVAEDDGRGRKGLLRKLQDD